MRNIYLLLLTLFSFQLVAQVSTNPATLEKTIDVNDENGYIFDIKVKNEGNSEVSLHWFINKGADVPSGWQIYLCDANLCYPPGVLKNSANKPNKIPANTEVLFQLHVNAEGIVGAGTLSIQLFTDANMQNMVWETDNTGVITASVPSKVINQSSDDLSVYPNPTDNFFSIKNGSAVSKVTLFNIVGREVKRFNNGSSNYFDISDLNKGIYLVRASDSKGKIIKTVRLSKR